MTLNIRRHGDGPAGTTHLRTETTVEINRQDAPLASVANLASTLGATEDRVRAMLGRLRSGGWVASVLRGMTERQPAPLLPDQPGRGPALHN